MGSASWQWDAQEPPDMNSTEASAVSQNWLDTLLQHADPSAAGGVVLRMSYQNEVLIVCCRLRPRDISHKGRDVSSVSWPNPGTNYYMLLSEFFLFAIRISLPLFFFFFRLLQHCKTIAASRTTDSCVSVFADVIFTVCLEYIRKHSSVSLNTIHFSLLR